MTKKIISNSDDTNKIIIYTNDEGALKIQVQVIEDTVWLTIAQRAELFSKSPSTINEHILNIYREEEVSKTPLRRKSEIPILLKNLLITII